MRRFALAVISSTLLAAAHAAAQDAPASTEAATEAASAAAGSSATIDADAADDARGEDVVSSLGSAIGEPSLAATPETTETTSRHRLPWREEWPRYSFDEAVFSLGLGALLLAAQLLPTTTSGSNWTDVNALDGAVHDGLMLALPAQRESARIAGDVLMWIDFGFPLVIDALFVAGIGDNSWDTALQMGLISAEAYIVSLVVWRVTSLLARRERPVTHDCQFPVAGSMRNPSMAECANTQPTQSFVSNTAVNAFTGAGLTCLQHTSMSMFGDEGADATACVGALTVASVAGLLRVMSNLEYLTDVVGGAVIGLLSGWLLPYLLHYQGGARPELRPALAAVPLPMVGPGDTVGLDVVGWF
jgi:membrane-associated phospholipid phosphatase